MYTITYFLLSMGHFYLEYVSLYYTIARLTYPEHNHGMVRYALPLNPLLCSLQLLASIM